MKRILIALVLTLLSFTGFAQDFPEKPNKLVNDYTGTLNPDQIGRLEQKLVAFDDSTSNQIAIAILKSVGDYDINEYALELGRKWGVGSKGKNNGIMIVVALGDRKISIQTGYGLEGVLPDLYARRIIDNDIKPYFKAGDYFKGLDSGTDAIISYTKGEYKNDKPHASKQGAGIPGVIIVVIIVGVIIAIIGTKRGGRGGGGGGSVINSRGVADALFWSALLGSGRSSGGGSWGGGSSSGGGGFGGFGGGSFGGGGSSGSW